MYRLHVKRGSTWFEYTYHSQSMANTALLMERHRNIAVLETVYC